MLLSYNEVRNGLASFTLGEHAYVLTAHHREDFNSRFDEVIDRIFGQHACCEVGAEGPVDTLRRTLLRQWSERQLPQRPAPAPKRAKPSAIGTALGLGVTVATFLLPVLGVLALFGH
ncbi:MAG: hypothetical protein QM699_06810 [Amaricoccus sp.]|uniref:hypothetical protein n=1 Tax=Amaricoccus sp. TaxID=1872485 RepID=UPI0039E3D442